MPSRSLRRQPAGARLAARPMSGVMVVIVRKTPRSKPRSASRRLVEQRHAGGNQSIERSREGKHPEAGRDQCFAERKAAFNGVRFFVLGIRHLFLRPRFAHKEQGEHAERDRDPTQRRPERTPIGVKCLKGRLHAGECGHEAQCNQERVNADRHAGFSPRHLSNECQTDHREARLPETAGQKDEKEEIERYGRPFHPAGEEEFRRGQPRFLRHSAMWHMARTTAPRAIRTIARESRTPMRSIAQPIGRQNSSAEQRGPEVECGERHASQAEVGHQRFGDEAEAVSAARQSRDHRRGRDSNRNPSPRQKTARRSRRILSSEHR